jgi:hypothetical protein
MCDAAEAVGDAAGAVAGAVFTDDVVCGVCRCCLTIAAPLTEQGGELLCCCLNCCAKSAAELPMDAIGKCVCSCLSGSLCAIFRIAANAIK